MPKTRKRPRHAWPKLPGLPTTFWSYKQMKHLSFKRNAKGFSLIELLIVLGIIAILLVAAFIVYPQVRDRNQANAEVTNLTTIKANITNLYASKGGNYDGLLVATAFNARAFPTNMQATATGGTAPWGGAVTVAEGTTPRLFDINYTAVPAAVCLGMVSGAAGNFEQIVVGGEEVLTSDGTAAGTAANASAGGQFAPDAAAAACNAAATADITFTSN